jgi:hypothetical protein
VRLQREGGYTAFHIAALCGRLECAMQLLLRDTGVVWWWARAFHRNNADMVGFLRWTVVDKFNQSIHYAT